MIKYIFLIFCFSSCAGTTGHLKFYDFDITKYEVEKALLQVINEDSTYRVPAKWKSHTKGDFLKEFIFTSPMDRKNYIRLVSLGIIMNGKNHPQADLD